MKFLDRIRKWRKRSYIAGVDKVPQDSSVPRFQDRRRFRLERLRERTKLAKARKWMWIALMVIAAVVGIIALKFGITGGLL